MAVAEFVCISTVEHDGEVILNYMDPITAAVRKKVNALDSELLDHLYDSGVIVEKALLPDEVLNRPEGNSDRVGFRVPGVSETAARVRRMAAEDAAQGKTPEVDKDNANAV